MRAVCLAAAACLLLTACVDGGQSDDTPAGSVPGDTGETAPYAGIGAEERLSFTGTEPFWSGEVRGDWLTYRTPDEPDDDAITVTRFAGRGGVSWSGTWRGAPLRLAVSEGRCADGMSGRAYPFVATLMVQGKQQSGCAWTERRGFTESEKTVSPAGRASGG